MNCSRNTAQKQWDETLVLVLGGVSRILRSFFPFLRSLSNFWSGELRLNPIDEVFVVIIVFMPIPQITPGVSPCRMGIFAFICEE